MIGSVQGLDPDEDWIRIRIGSEFGLDPDSDPDLYGLRPKFWIRIRIKGIRIRNPAFYGTCSYGTGIANPCVRHVTGNDKDYLRKIPRVVW